MLDTSGIFYQSTVPDLAEKIQGALSHHNELDSYKTAARERIKERYSWDSVADDYERMFIKMIK